MYVVPSPELGRDGLFGRNFYYASMKTQVWIPIAHIADGRTACIFKHSDREVETGELLELTGLIAWPSE